MGVAVADRIKASVLLRVAELAPFTFGVASFGVSVHPIGAI